MGREPQGQIGIAFLPFFPAFIDGVDEGRTKPKGCEVRPQPGDDAPDYVLSPLGGWISCGAISVSVQTLELRYHCRLLY